MKLQFLPHLSGRTWFGIWLIAMVVMVGDFVGSRVFGLWNIGDIGTFCMVVFLLLMVTPVDASGSSAFFWMPPPPPRYDPTLSHVTNARRMLAWLQAYPRFAAPGMVEAMHAIIAIEDAREQEAKAQDTRQGDSRQDTPPP